MNLGLYSVGENQPIIRLRRARAHFDGRIHVVPASPSREPSLCGGLSASGRPWEWSDDDVTGPTCLNRVRAALRAQSMVHASPAVVAEFERQRVADPGDREPARLAVEIYRPRDGVMGSVGTRREIHLPDCPLVGTYERPMVLLPVSEVRRQKNADGARTSFCQECKPFHVLDNERRRPRTLAEARRLSEIEGSAARERFLRNARRTTRNPHRSYAFRTLPHDGSGHFEDCPAEADALMHGNVTEPDYGRCKCYVRYATARPGERPDDDDSPDWTIG
jgi:hypothetical protein